MTMHLSDKGAAFIGHHEGFVPRWYLDPVGIPTIGKGFTWASTAFREWWEQHRPGQRFERGATMTRAEADDALRVLIEREYGAAVNGFLGRGVPQHVFDAMCSVVFNAGAGTLADRWAAVAKRGDYEAAADLLETTRVTAKGKRLRGLVTRRKEEAQLLERGDYAIGATGGAPREAGDDGLLSRGERGEAVTALQRDLAELGHYDGRADGVFGPGTEAAVMAFQRSAGLADDGRAGPKTLAAIAQARAPAPTAAPAPAPAPAAVPVEKVIVVPAPAPIGHNGGPPLAAPEPAVKPNLTPLEQMNKPVQGAKAGLGASTFGGAVVLLLASAGWLPSAWSSGEAAIALGLVAGTLSNQIGAFVGGYLARDKRFQQ